MMKNKRVVWSIVIIGFLALYLVISNIHKKSADLPAIKGWDSADEIIIKNSDKEFKIYNKVNKWFVGEGFDADQNKASSLEKGMRDLTVTDYISKGYFQKYDLSPEKAIKVTVKKDGEIMRDILIGKASSTSANTYVKFADDDRIYLAKGNLHEDYNINVEGVRDKKIIRLDKNEIQGIEIDYQGRLTFEKKIEKIPAVNGSVQKNAKKEQKEDAVEKWICREAGNIEVDRQKLDSFLGSLSAVNADSFPILNKKDINGLICMVTGKSQGKEVYLKIHKKDGENYICTSSESPYVFGLQEWNAKKFFKKLSDFKK